MQLPRSFISIFVYCLIIIHSANTYAVSACKDDGPIADGSGFLTNVTKRPGEKLKSQFQPADLRVIPSQFVKNTSGATERLRQEALQQLIKMLTAAHEQGHQIKVYSAYRSFQQQCGAYDSKFRNFKSKIQNSLKPGQDLQTELTKYVNQVSATPGRSEHQLGTAFDLVYPSLNHKLVYPDIQNRCAGNLCAEYKWLLENAHQYGFALSYPRMSGTGSENNTVTGYIFEPWHWRYIGRENAEELIRLSIEKGQRISIQEYIDIKTKLVSRNPASQSEEIVIGMGGDVSLSKPGSTQLAANGSVFNKFYTWEQMTTGLQPLTANNDFNFMNLESVVSTKNLLPIEGKKWPQKSHPQGILHLIKNLGFNLISTANNHAYDYDQQGLEETLSHLEQISAQLDFPIAYSGVGFLNETLEPIIMEKNGIKIAFAAIGMKGDDRPHWEKSWSPTPNKVGMLSIRICKDGSVEKPLKPCQPYGDLVNVLEKLKAAQADLKILSVHDGMELSVYTRNGQKPDTDAIPEKGQKQRQRSENRNIEAKFQLIQSYGIDLIIGHHSHNVRPIHFNQKSLSFFGLGNLLFLGGKNYSTNQFPMWNRFGLFAKTYYNKNVKTQTLELSAIQLIPLKNIHISPRLWSAEESHGFIDHINRINKISFPDMKIQFKKHSDGTGVYCLPNVQKGPRARLLCDAVTDRI